MPDPPERSPKSKNRIKGFKYSQNGEDYVDEKLEGISRAAYDVANQKAKLLSKKKQIEVSEEHLRDAIDFVLKTGVARPPIYWFFRIITNLSYIIGGILVKDGFGDFSFKPETVSSSNITLGLIIITLTTIIDLMVLHKK